MRATTGLIAATLLGFLPMHGQEPRETQTPGTPAAYHVEFDVRDSGGATPQTRHYAMVVEENRKGVFEAGDRIPASRNSPDGPTLVVGAKVECLVRQTGSKLEIAGGFELRKVEGEINSGGIAEPIIGQARVEFRQAIEPGAPAVIATAAKYQVQATVTQLQSGSR